MWWTSGCAPVTSEDMHTGVSEGNVVTARPYVPCSARNVNAGVRLSPTAASNIDGVRPSMTMRTNLVAGKKAQSCETLGRASAQARGKRRHDGGFQVADSRDPRERGQHHGCGDQDERRADARSAATERACDHARAAE